MVIDGNSLRIYAVILLSLLSFCVKMTVLPQANARGLLLPYWHGPSLLPPPCRRDCLPPRSPRVECTVAGPRQAPARTAAEQRLRWASPCAARLGVASPVGWLSFDRPPRPGIRGRVRSWRSPQ
jgi:hypothetical protein